MPFPALRSRRHGARASSPLLDRHFERIWNSPEHRPNRQNNRIGSCCSSLPVQACAKGEDRYLIKSSVNKGSTMGGGSIAHGTVSHWCGRWTNWHQVSSACVGAARECVLVLQRPPITPAWGG